MVEISPEHAHNLATGFFAMVEEVYREYVTSQRRRDVAPTSPLAIERELLSNGSVAMEKLHLLGRAAASRAEVAGGHSLAAILRLLRHPDDVGPATAALYPLARAAIEGATIAHHLLEADISFDQRLLRVAQILVWSEQGRLTFSRDLDGANNTTKFTTDAENEWAQLANLLQAASIASVGRGDKPWQRLARGNDSIGRFEILRLTHQTGVDTSLLYRTLSGIAHHAPWITETHTYLTLADENGAYFATRISQSEQVDLVANVCRALLATATTKARFYGVTTERLDDLAGRSSGFFASMTRTLIAAERQG